MFALMWMALSLISSTDTHPPTPTITIVLMGSVSIGRAGRMVGRGESELLGAA